MPVTSGNDAFTHALTIDLEDWYHPEFVKGRVPAAPTARVAEATRPILDLLRRYDVRATFFVLGEVAQTSPDLIRAIRDEGHEIASHGVSHRTLWELDPDAFRSELCEFRERIDGILGPTPVHGFRAPTFSLDRRTPWAPAILEELGYRYDSSIFPVRNGYYGVPDAPLAPYFMDPEEIARPAAQGLVEFPLTVLRVAGTNIPLAGGFYLRILPLAVLLAGLRRVARRRPFVIYVHPWECSPSTPRLALPWRARLILYSGMGSALTKLEALLREFAFGSMREVIERHVEPGLAGTAPPTRSGAAD